MLPLHKLNLNDAPQLRVERKTMVEYSPADAAARSADSLAHAESVACVYESPLATYTPSAASLHSRRRSNKKNTLVTQRTASSSSPSLLQPCLALSHPCTSRRPAGCATDRAVAGSTNGAGAATAAVRQRHHHAVTHDGVRRERMHLHALQPDADGSTEYKPAARVAPTS
jgi:hypothetical protein